MENTTEQAEGGEQATKEGCSSVPVEEAPEHDVDPAEVDAAMAVADGAITQILASEQSVKILEERGKLMVDEGTKEQEHSYEARLKCLSCARSFEEDVFWNYISHAEISGYVNVAYIHKFLC